VTSAVRVLSPITSILLPPRSSSSADQRYQPAGVRRFDSRRGRIIRFWSQDWLKYRWRDPKFSVMATKSERFKAEQQRASRAAHPKRPPGGRSGKRGGRGDGNPVPPSHNAAPRAGRNSSYELEASAGGQRPSRKSSRKSAGRSKPDSALRIKAMNRTASPQARATRGHD
jgi:hypothetical protein